MIFELDQKDLRKLLKFAKKAPTSFRRASKDVLNDQAFALKNTALDQIRKTMIVRSPGFVNSSMRVVKAKTGSSISTQQSATGSIYRERFSGWVEQETGKPSQRERIASLVARGGGKRGKIKPRFKFKPGKKFVRPKQFGGKDFQSKIRAMFRIMGSRKKREMFLLSRKYKKMRPGLYLFHSKKITKIQDTEPRALQPRRNRWMTKAVSRMRRTFDVRRSWKKNIAHELQRRL